MCMNACTSAHRLSLVAHTTTASSLPDYALVSDWADQRISCGHRKPQQTAANQTETKLCLPLVIQQKQPPQIGPLSLSWSIIAGN